MLKLCIFAVLLAVTYGQQNGNFVCAIINDVDCTNKGHDKVCGSNLVTYLNRCELGKAYCLHNYIHLRHNGSCISGDTSTTTMSPQQVEHGSQVVASVMCSYLSYVDCITITTNNEKVCGTDNILYPNFCEYEKMRCSHSHLGVKAMEACP